MELYGREISSISNYYQYEQDSCGRPVRPVRLAVDGPEAFSIAIRAACDYKKEVLPVPANRKLTVKMASGGGYAARITKR